VSSSRLQPYGHGSGRSRRCSGVEVIQEAGHYLGIAIANVVNLFNPSMVIIGGEMLELVISSSTRCESGPAPLFFYSLSAVEVVPSFAGTLYGRNRRCLPSS